MPHDLVARLNEEIDALRKENTRLKTIMVEIARRAEEISLSLIRVLDEDQY